MNAKDFETLTDHLKQIQFSAESIRTLVTGEAPEIITVEKSYMTTDQFIVVWKSLDDDKYKELKAARDAARYAAWDAAWYAARYADLAIVVRDKITPDQFNTLVQPWTSCGLSLYAEDWQEVIGKNE